MEVPSISQKKNTFRIPYLDSQVVLSGNFDSGNLNNAILDVQNNQIMLYFGRDKQIKPSSKSWFYFSVQAASPYLPIKLNLQKTNSLCVISKSFDLYRPVIKLQGQPWQRYHSPIQFSTSAQNQTSFRLTIDILCNKKVYIALCYPWSFSQNQAYLNTLQQRLANRPDIYFNKETLIYTPMKLPVHLLAISSGEVRGGPEEAYVEHLFPERHEQAHFRRIGSKPVIFVTARVHPSEVGASYALMGIIDFLVGGGEEAKRILSEFYVLIVPMLNPDGVQMGNNRLDFYGQNLNRFYLLPDLEMQPVCFAVKSILQSNRHQIYAFFDLHGHANKKSCFLFGNSINNNRLQTESVLFAKYLSSICEYVEFKSCNFSKKQMFSKDKGQDLSKEGCARVVVHKWTNSPYCYTLQTGLFKNVKVDQKGIQRYGDKFYNPEIYAEVGWKMIISLYRILKKSKQVEQMRKQVGQYVLKLVKINVGPKKVLKKQSIKQMKVSTKQIKDPSPKQQKQPAQLKQPKPRSKHSKQPLQKQQPNLSTRQLKAKGPSQKGPQLKSSCSQKQNQKYRSIQFALKSNKATLLNYEEKTADYDDDEE